MKALEKAALEFFARTPELGKRGFAEELAGGWEGKSSYLRQCYERVAYDVVKRLKEEGKLKLARRARYQIQGGVS